MKIRKQTIGFLKITSPIEIERTKQFIKLIAPIQASLSHIQLVYPQIIADSWQDVPHIIRQQIAEQLKDPQKIYNLYD